MTYLSASEVKSCPVKRAFIEVAFCVAHGKLLLCEELLQQPDSTSVVFSVDSVDLSQCDAAANKFVCYHTSYMNETVGNRILGHMSNSWTGGCMISANVERLDCRSY